MVRRLAAIAQQQDLSVDVFASHRRVERMLADLASDPHQPSTEVELRLAGELVRAGRPQEAVDRLTALLEVRDLSAADRRAATVQLAIAELRLGELQNCVDDHSSASCLLPISAHGRHRFPEHTARALELYGSLLQADPDDLGSRWLYNLAAMALGRYPSEVPAKWLIPPAAFESEVDFPRFDEVGHLAGVSALGRAGGVVLDDFDGDGDLDLLVSSWGLEDPLRYFRNRGDGRFEEATEMAGLAGLTGGLNIVHADYDNDGWLDALVLRGAWLGPAGRHPDSLLRNRGDGTFEDVTEAAGLLAFHPGQTAAWADVDLDGWVDVFVGHETTGLERHACRFLRNRGDGTFEDRTAESGLGIEGFVKAALWGDVDNDGLVDLFVSRLGQPNLLMRNRGDGTFEDVAEQAGVGEPIFSFPAFFFDFDNDGNLDLFVGGYASSYVQAGAQGVAAAYLGLPTDLTRPRLFRNRGDGSFEDVSREMGVDRPTLPMGCNFGDLDNDGYLDFYLGTGAPDLRAQIPNLMYRNVNGRRFVDVTAAGGFGHLQKGHGVAFGDVDADGDQDVFAVIGGAFSGDVSRNVLFENPGSEAHWIELRLEGTDSSRDALGARVRVDVQDVEGPRSIHRVVSSGGSFGAASLRLAIGLGTARQIERIEVRWPRGGRQVFEDLPLDQALVLREGSSTPSPAVRR